MEFDDVEVVAATEKAMLLRFYGNEEHWVPRSQIEGSSVDEKGDKGTVLLSTWITDKIGLG